MCINLSQRERKKHSIVRRARTLCAFSPCCRSFYSRRQTFVSLKAGCVRGKICFKEIVSNTRLDLIHSSFTHLVCQFIIIWRFLFIYTVSIYYFCLLHLFMLSLIFRSVCYSFLLITKVNCWNISKNLKADLCFLIYFCDYC